MCSSDLVRPVKLFPQRLINVTVADKDAALEAASVAEAIAAAEAELQGNGRILVRPSGTEPLIRVMVEAETEPVADRLASEVAEAVSAATA